jgi:UDP-N-acetylglucosamine:LPS N-acetylglucosamine transferase
LEAEEIAKTAKFPVKVIGYSEDVEKLMHSANVMISKLGGLTTFEALACRLPIIADITTPPMPQEAGTVKLIAGRGAGILLKHAIDIVPTIRSLVNDSDKYRKMKIAAGELSVPNSTEQIIREITSLLPMRERSVAA